MSTVKTNDLTETRAPEVEPGSGSLLDDLLALPEISDTQYIDIAVPKRPGYYARFDDLLSGGELRANKKAAMRGKRGDVDATVMNGLILVDHNVAILRKLPDGSLKVIPSENGEPLTFSSLEFMEKFGDKGATLDSVVSAKNFLGEAFLVMAGNKVTEFAGWGDEVDGEAPEDPTRG